MRIAIVITAGLMVAATAAWRHSQRREGPLQQRTRRRLLYAVPNASDISVPIS